MTPIIFHIDVNSAFLSWTCVERLKQDKTAQDLRLIPAIIGGDQLSRHGVVLAKSVPAKKYGIRTGEPVANALRKCPNLVMAPPDHKLYHQYSQQMMAYLRTLTPDIQQLSVDECFLDFTGIAKQYESPVAGAEFIKDSIRETFGFTVNVGVSSNKLLAKMASDFEKPDKVHTLWPEEIPEKMWPLPVGDLYMAGHASVEALEKLEIRTIGELAKADPELLALHLKSHGRMLWESANGRGDATVYTERAEAKGIGNSTTVSTDITTREEAKKVLLSLAESVGGRLRKAEQKAGMISVEIKYATFQSVSHQKQLPRATNADQVICREAVELFEELWTGEPVRLLGIRSSKLAEESEPEQMSLFDLQPENIKDEKHQKADRAADELRKRFGNDSIIKGSRL